MNSRINSRHARELAEENKIEDIEYEMFGDISVMEMTVNHISSVISNTGDPGPARWLHPDLVQDRLEL